MATKTAAETEVALQRMVTIYVVTGLYFCCCRGRSRWNLISISGRHSLAGLSQACRLRTRADLAGSAHSSLGSACSLSMGVDARGGESRMDSWALWTGVTLVVTNV
jgi:hypothetical protein